MFGSNILRRIDWLSVIIFVLLVAIGWVNIYSSTFTEDHTSIFDISQLYGKQLVFIGVSLLVAAGLLLVGAALALLQRPLQLQVPRAR